MTGTVRSRDEGKMILERYLQPFEEVERRFIPNNMTERAFDVLLQKVNDDSKFGYEIT